MKCRRCGEPVYPGNAYCQTCSEAMARRSQEMEAAAAEKAATPKREESHLIRSVLWVTVIGAVLSISPYLFFRAEEKVQSAGRALNNLTETRSTAESSQLASTAKPSLSIGRAQRTASLDAAMGTGLDPEASTDAKPDAPKSSINHFPPLVSDWVAGLASFEKQRQNLALSQLASSFSASDDDRKTLGEQFEGEWIQLLSKFEKVEAPGECQELAAAYSRTLRETASAVMSKVREPKLASTTVSDSENAATVLVPPAQDADQLLHTLCSKFGSSKDFEIQTQVKTPTPH